MQVESHGVMGAVRDQMKLMAHRLLARESVAAIEEDALSGLSRVPGIRHVVSAYHRAAASGSALCSEGDKYGEYSVFINPIDGIENYSRGSRFFGASALVVHIGGSCHSFILDGTSGRLRESDSWRRSEGFSEPSGTKRVLAIGRFPGTSASECDVLGSISIRWFGSTTLAVLAVADRHVDVVLNKTKAWNVWWAIPLAANGVVVIEPLLTLPDMLGSLENGTWRDTSSLALFCTHPGVENAPWVQTFRTGFMGRWGKR